MTDAGAIHEHFGGFHEIFGINLTNRCNIECRHCGTESGPHETCSLDIPNLLRAAHEAALDGSLRGFHVSGGEPFLFPRKLEQISEFAVCHGLLLAVNSNASWATSSQSAKRQLVRLPGLTQLNVSTDVYHAEFVSLERVRTAVECSIELGLRVQVAVCTPQGKQDEFTDMVSAILGKALAAEIKLLVYAVEPYGRGKHLAEANSTAGRSAHSGCVQLNRPIVMENGRYHACCNSAVAQTLPASALQLGDIRSISLRELRERAGNDLLLQAIRVWGPAKLYELAQAAGGSMAYPRGAGACDACAQALSNPTLIALAQAALESASTRRDLSISRAALYDEWQELRWPSVVPPCGRQVREC